MSSGKELREYTRIRMKVNVEVERSGSAEKRIGNTECVSMNGLFIECEKPFPLGTQCVVTLFTAGRGSDVLVHARGKITFVNAAGMAAQLTSHLDMESYNHLRNLVLYNAAEESEQVETEIQRHLDKIRKGSEEST